MLKGTNSIEQMERERFFFLKKQDGSKHSRKFGQTGGELWKLTGRRIAEITGILRRVGNVWNSI